MKYDELGIPIYTPSEIQRRTSEFGGTIGFPCSIGLIYGIVRLFKYSFVDWQGWTIIIGAIISFFGIIAYSITIIEYKRYKKRSWKSSIFSWIGLVPYLFGCFLVFYKGFWSFKYLLVSFLFWKLITPIIWIVIGYRIVSQLYLLTEFGKAIDDGKIKIEKEN